MSDTDDYTCSECGDEFETLTALKRHKVETHENPTDDEAIEMGPPTEDEATDDTTSHTPTDPQPDQPDESGSEQFAGGVNRDRDADTDRTATGRSTSTDSTDESSRSGADVSLGSGSGKKWYMIGVGGAGSGIVDAAMLRQEALDDQSDRTDIWEGALEGRTILDTNREELQQTYYVQRESVELIDHTIGKSGDGAGESPFVGRLQMWQDISNKNVFQAFDIDQDKLDKAQAVLLVHSLAKGTGTGATGLLSELFSKIKYADEDEDEIYSTPTLNLDKPIVTASILPSDDSNRDEWTIPKMENSLFGFATAGRFADLVIPFDNKRLERLPDTVRVNLDYDAVSRHSALTDQSEQIEPADHLQEANRTLIHYLEVMSMTSNTIFNAPKSPLGLDVPDLINPPREEYPNQDSDFVPAVVGAPVLYAERTGFPDDPYRFIERALDWGQLMEFDPGTAWGGAFIFYGTREIIEQYEQEMRDGISGMIKTVLQDEFGADYENPYPELKSIPGGTNTGSSNIDIRADHTFVEDRDADRLHMWGLLWNPKIDRLENIAEDLLERVFPNKNTVKTALLKGEGEDIPNNYEKHYNESLSDLIEKDAEDGLRPYTDLIETQLSLLGREKQG